MEKLKFIGVKAQSSQKLNIILGSVKFHRILENSKVRVNTEESLVILCRDREITVSVRNSISNFLSRLSRLREMSENN